MRISKKLSTLVGMGGLYFLQANGVEVEQSRAVLQETMGGIQAQAAQSPDILIYYLSAIYIAVQGLYDIIKGWKSQEGKKDEKSTDN